MREKARGRETEKKRMMNHSDGIDDQIMREEENRMGTRTTTGRAKDEAAFLWLGRKLMISKLRDFEKVTQESEKHVDDWKDPDERVESDDMRAKQFAEIAESCNQKHRMLKDKWELMQQSMVETIQCFGGLSVRTMVGKVAESLIVKWETMLEQTERNLEAVLQKNFGKV